MIISVKQEVQVEVHPQPPDDESSSENKRPTAKMSTSMDLQKQNSEATKVKQPEGDTEQENNNQARKPGDNVQENDVHVRNMLHSEFINIVTSLMMKNLYFMTRLNNKTSILFAHTVSCIH